MTRDVPKNLAASVHQRLMNKSKSSSRPFNELLQLFAIERFIYRLSQSLQADKFILKGALMFATWSPSIARPTMDIDLLGKLDNSLEVIADAMKDACRTAVTPDGVAFDAETVVAIRIKEDAEYEGVRVRLQAALGNARIPMQIDVGFGDVIVPKADRVTYPVLLDFPAPELLGYTMETAIAEKYQAMVTLGILNSRMKDFYDIWKLAGTFDFSGDTLSEAIKKTFDNRHTPLDSNAAIFEPSFATDDKKAIQWRAFIKKSQLDDAPKDFSMVVAAIKNFLAPVTEALVDRRSFTSAWTAPGIWSSEA